VTARSVSGYLRLLSDDGLSAKTVNSHRADLAAFCGWAVRSGLMEADPCEHVAKSTVKAEKKRRALSVAECKALLTAAPEDRRLVYLFLVFTGLRRSEAADIRWGHVHLDVPSPHVELPATLTKSGKAESVPLVPEVVAALRASKGDGKASAPVFEEIPSMDAFREDLAAAKIEEVDARGRRVVLHSLRHSLATMLAISQVPMAVAQRIMRHRDIRLTAEVYTDEGLLPLSAAMASLPSLSNSEN
jgi:integrase